MQAAKNIVNGTGYSTTVKKMGLTGFKSWFHSLLAMWSWASYLTSWFLGVLTFNRDSNSIHLLL